MKMITKLAATFAILCASLCCAGTRAGAGGEARSGGDPISWSFEDCAPGILPSVWSVAETSGAGKPARWGAAPAERDGARGSAMRVLETNNSGATFNLLLYKEPCPADLAIDVKILAVSGKEDAGGGVAWRAADENNYYVARWNPLEKNLRVYKVEAGKRKMFQNAAVDADPQSWHSLSVRMRGASMEIAFDGKTMLRHEDTTFPGPGRVGLWTKADAATAFDDVEVRSIR